MRIKMKCLFVALLTVVTYQSATEACSCAGISERRESLRNGVCRGDVFVARVTGAMCNCLPAEGETHNVSCQDYRFPQSPGSTVIAAELTNRGRCYAERGFYVGALRVCSTLDTEIIPEADGANASNDSVPVQNTTRSTDFGSCYLSCPFNDPENSTGIGGNVVQPCYYAVTITEVIKGNYTVGQTLMRSGPDVLIACGNHTALLRLNQQYVAGVGGPCQEIRNDWNSLDFYSTDELQRLRDYAQMFENGMLDCGAFGLFPSFFLLLIVAVIGIAIGI